MSGEAGEDPRPENSSGNPSSDGRDADPPHEDSGRQPAAQDAAEEAPEENWEVTLDDLEGDAPNPIEPGSPSPEHVGFVLLGVALTLAVIYRLATLVGTTIG
jgi:hypothetical protein